MACGHASFSVPGNDTFQKDIDTFQCSLYSVGVPTQGHLFFIVYLTVFSRQKHSEALSHTQGIYKNKTNGV